MALPTNTFATYEAVGNREDLSDVIYRIDPTDTPAMTGFERAKATAVNHEWQTQALAAVDTSNYVLEGDDATTDAATPTVRLGNVCQILDKVARVTGTQQAVQHSGRDDELAYQEMLKGLELKRDMETLLVGVNIAKVTGSDFTGRATPTEETKSKKIIAAVDAYESDFGTVKVVPNRFQRARDVLVLEMDKWAVAYLSGRKMLSIPLAKTGDSDRRQMMSEYALEARNEKASGGVFDNTTS